MSKTILVTGGAGFCGVNFVYYLLKKYPDYRIICADGILFTSSKHSLDEAMSNPQFCFYEMNICDRIAVDKIFSAEKPDVVVNFAAESQTERKSYNRDTKVFLHTNILGTQTLLDACREYGCEHFHQASTGSVYGNLSEKSDGIPYTEDAPVYSANPYSASKASADILALSYCCTFNLPVTISRCTDVYGQYQFPNKSIPLLITSCLNDQRISVSESGDIVHNLLHVSDLCRAIDLIIHKGKVGEIYNVSGTGMETNSDIGKLICRAAGKADDLVNFSSDSNNTANGICLDATKIRNDLGWQPETELEDGVTATVEWYRYHRRWWEEIISGMYRD